MTSTEDYATEYKKFMYDESNIMNCQNCPENNNFDSWQDKLPCGQWHCWVEQHCSRN